ncbi:MAG: PIN domain-containing protein, partial [bacterium]
MILVDTSVWIDFFADADKDHVKKFKEALEQNENVCICGVIMTEVLHGIRSDSEFVHTQNALKKLIYLPFNQEIFINAASIYRLLRKNGITLQSPTDCLIASLAIYYKVPLLH